MFRFVCAAVTLVLTVPAVAESLPSGKGPPAAASFALPVWGTPQPSAPALQFTIRGATGWFRIAVPAGWQLNADRLSGRILVNGADGRGVRVWMMLVPRTVAPEDAASLLASVNVQIWPKGVWSPASVKRVGARTIVTALSRDVNDTRTTGLSLIPAGRVTVAFYASAFAPSKIFDRSRDVFAAILESYVPLPGYVGGAPGLERIVFDRWTDPLERAFSLDVPKGWKVQGGTVRKAANDVRQVVRLIDPEQSALIQLGDAEIPPFIAPSEALPEGRVYGSAQSMEFQPGPAFGRSYLEWRARALMPDLAIDRIAPLPALQSRLQAIQDAYATGGIERRIEAGELVFRGTWKGRPAKGYLFAATTRIDTPGSDDMWVVGDLGTLQGFVAAEDRVSTAIAVMDRMRTSFEVNPQWFRDNARSVEALSRMATQASDHVATAIVRTFANGQARAVSIYDRYVDYRRDVVPFKSPQGAKVEPVQVGSNYYWMGTRGFVLGTSEHFNPDPLWFRELVTIKP
ncbi:MAG: hypothetical protein ACRECO_14025 [Xanthobacteraceae bacterium]